MIPYGINSILRPGEIPSSPYNVAACPSRPSTRDEISGQNESSFLRTRPRYRMIPHSCCLVAGKRKLLKGIAIHTTKPRLVTLPLESHTVSKEVSQLPLTSARDASVQIASHC